MNATDRKLLRAWQLFLEDSSGSLDEELEASDAEVRDPLRQV